MCTGGIDPLLLSMRDALHLAGSAMSARIPGFPPLFTMALILLLCGCSATRIAYQNADSLIAGYAEKHLDLDEAQSQRLRERLASWLDWHRREQLPEMRGQLERLRGQVADGLTAREAATLIDTVRGSYKALIAGMLPMSAELFVSLTPRQLEQLEQSFAESNAEYREELLTDSSVVRREQRLQRFIRQAQRWVGDLSEVQTQWLGQQLLRHPSTADAWLEYRMTQQKRLLSLLRRRAAQAQIERFLIEWMVERRGLSPTLAIARARLMDDAPQLLRIFDSGLSSQQRNHWLERLDFYLNLAGKMTLARAAQDVTMRSRQQAHEAPPGERETRQRPKTVRTAPGTQ